MTEPLVSFWVTSTGRPCVLDCVREVVRLCKYPNYQLLIFESQPDNPHNTVDVFKSLECEKHIWTGDYPPLGWIYNLLMANTDRFIQRLDDDCWPVCDPTELFQDAIRVLNAQPIRGATVSHVATEMNPRVYYNQRETAEAIAKDDATFVGGGEDPAGRPFSLYRHPSGIALMDKSVLMPWNESCHWRQTELYHILDCERRGLVTMYMLWWWGVIGHFSDAGIDGVDRSKQANLYNRYQMLGYCGRRPAETWHRAFLGMDLPMQQRMLAEAHANGQ